MKNILICGLATLVISANSHAANFSCGGKINSIALNPTSGTLQVNAGHGVHYLCKIHTEFNGVHPEICKAWYSMFLTAQASDRKIEQYYNDGSGTTCSTLGSWAVPNPMPYYVELKK